jgi:mRNA-degrading endonuclease RelE of RelBE toxin-antitoxin system
MAFTIEFTASAEREFKALERSTQRRVAKAIDGLAENPFHPASKSWKASLDFTVLEQVITG